MSESYIESLKQRAKIKKCLNCGREYVTFCTRGKFCSDNCRLEYYKKQGIKYPLKFYKDNPKVTRECLYCHESFQTRQKNHQRFCSSECANKYRRILDRIMRIKWYYGSEFDFEQEFRAKGKDFRFPEPFTWLNKWLGLELKPTYGLEVNLGDNKNETEM